MQAPKKTPIMLARAQFRSVLGWLVLFSLVVNLLLLVMPLYMLQVYDRILPSQSMQTLIFLSIFAVGALVVLGLLEAVRAVIAGRAAAKLETTLGAETMRIAMLRGRATGGDIQPVRDLAAVRTFLASRSLFALLDLPFAPLFIGLLYIIHPLLFWITVGGAVVLFLVAILNQWVTSAPSTLAGQRQGGALTSAQAMSRNSDTLQAMGMVGNAIAKWGQNNSEALTAQGVVDTRNAVLSGISRTIRMGLQIAILGVGAWLVLAGEMTAGMIFAASIISGRGLQPIDQVIGSWKQFVVTWRSWQKLADLLERVPQQQERTEMEAPRGDVSVEAALVAAPGGMGEAPILNRLTFKAEAGTIIGIVGPSGSGKSTLARLLVGAQMPNAGLVRVDGNDIRNWAPEQIGAAIGYLGQEPELLPASVKENIARLTPSASDEAVRSAAQNAQVHDLIQTFPHGYDTWLGPGGLQLSGGQKQRIALARAFFGSPRLIVLDEPNANLDETGERALHAALMNARASGATVFIVTQRDSALAAVDKVLRIVNGGIDFYDTRQNFVQAVGAARKAANDAAAASRAGEASKPRPQVVTKDGRPVAPKPQRRLPRAAGIDDEAGNVSPRDAFLKRFGTGGAADGSKPGDAS